MKIDKWKFEKLITASNQITRDRDNAFYDESFYDERY